MPIRLLAELVVAHPYFSSGIFAGAVVVPDAATAARLAGLRITAKARPGGLGLFADFTDDGKPRFTIPDKTKLGFVIGALPADVMAATDLTGIGPATVFTDDGVAAGQPLGPVTRQPRSRETLAKNDGVQALALAGRPLAGAAAADFAVLAPPAGVSVSGFDPASNRITLAGPQAAVTIDYPVRPPSAPGVFAPVEFTLSASDVAAAAAGKARRVTIALKPAAARWVYHLVTDLTNPIADWRIQHANGDGPAVAFSDAGRAEIAATAADDPFGADLAARSGALRVLRFLSDAPVPANEAVARRVALFAAQQQIFPALPNPSPTALRMVGGQPAFGQVIRFVTT
jgi:hypothetical protein